MTDQQEWIVAWFAAGGIFLSIYGIIRIVCWIIKKIKKVNMTNIRRNKLGHITGECMREMENSLPIELFVNQDTEPCYIAHTKIELAHYFDGALPYVLTTRYEACEKFEKKED